MPLTSLSRTPRDTRPPRSRLLRQALGLLPGPAPIRPRTLIALRWVAMAGQASAVLGAWALGARFPLAPVLAIILTAAVANLLLARRARAGAGESETLGQLVFDLVQTGLLLTLTGGIANPFALFVLVPLTIGATILPGRSLLGLALATGAMVTIMAVLPLPLRFSDTAAVPAALAIRAGHLLALAIGGAFFATYARRVSAELADTASALAATQLGLAREQRLQHLGGVVAAAAHEMGTPLATIKLIASELADELEDRPEVASDLAMLKSSADRCRDILRSMGAAGKDDLLLRSAPLGDVLAEAAAPHHDRGARITLDGNALALSVTRDAGLIHALRNLIQNGVDFAATQVQIRADRHDGRIDIRVGDDGPGYPPALLTRLGEPFLTTRRPAETESRSGATGYEGMGLGLFIARTLLQRTGGTVSFHNQQGAVAQVSWPEAALIADDRAALGANPSISS